MKLRGKVSLRLTDTETGQMNEFVYNNLLLDGYLNRCFTDTTPWLDKTTMNTCYLGTGNTSPAGGDIGLSGDLLASSDSYSILAHPGNQHRLADPTGGNPAGAGYDFSWSSDGNYLAVAHLSGSFMSWYKRDGDTLTKLADPTGGNPAGTGRGCSWSSDGNYLAVAHATSPFITTYYTKANTNTAYRTHRWEFPAGVGTGTIQELALQALDTTWVARFTPAPIEKNESYHLQVDWTIEFSSDELTSANVNSDSSSTMVSIANGSFNLGSLTMGGHNAWFGLTDTPSVMAGASNAPMVVGAFPWGYSTENPLIEEDASLLQVAQPYVPNSFEREFVVRLDYAMANTSIGELVAGFGRLTFDPPLNKVVDGSLQIPIKIQLERGV